MRYKVSTEQYLHMVKREREKHLRWWVPIRIN